MPAIPVSLLRLPVVVATAIALWLAGPCALAAEPLPPGIAWFDGDVGHALAEAARQGRPLFLYWGAAWCPPCNQLKATLFRDPAFQQHLAGYLPVYLDGDGEAAQRWGERFRVVGYPTLLVLAPDGGERARLLGETDLPRMLAILDLVREGGTPAATLAQRFDQGARLSGRDWQLLAAHAWELDPDAPSDAQRDRLARLARAAPADLPGLRARLWLHALANVQGSSTRWDSSGAAAELQAMLGDPALVHANRDLLESPPGTALDSLASGDPRAIAGLAAAWGAALQQLAGDEGLSCTERLASLTAWFEVPGTTTRSIDPLPLVQRCDAGTTDEIERQSVISGASDLLQAAGHPDLAAGLLEAEIPRAHVPAFFMMERAALARHQGDGEAATLWSGLGYANASGGATRLQWGLSYLRDLVTWSPDRAAPISELAALLLRDAARLPDAFADRNRRSLARLRSLLEQWSAADTVPETARQRLAQAWTHLCGSAPGSATGTGSVCPQDAIRYP